MRYCKILGAALLLFVIYSLPAAGMSGGCEIVVKGDSLLLRNAYVSLECVPGIGGAVTSLLYRGRDLTTKVPGEGVLQDLFWEDIDGRQYQKNTYKYEIMAHGPEEISLHLWSRGTHGNLQFVEYHKTIRLFRDSSVIRVDYEIKNLPQSTNDFTYSPWSHNILGVTGEENVYYFPTLAGIQAVRQNIENPQGNHYVNNATRGWSAVIAGGKTGIAGICDFAYLKNLYNWFGRGFVTVEWMYGPVILPCGGSFKTTCYYFPFSGLSSLSGVTSDIAASLDFASGRITAHLVAGRNITGRYTVRYRVLPDVEWRTIKDGDCVLSPDAKFEISEPVAYSQEGTYIFNLSVKEGNKEVGEAEISRVNGAASGVYQLAPKETKKFTEEKNYVAFTPSMEVETPHIPWAKPAFCGTTRGLFLLSAAQSREVVELSERMDLDYAVSTLCYSMWEIGWYPATTLFSKGFDEVEPLLDGRYDFILVSGSFNPQGWSRNQGYEVKWGSFSQPVRSKLLEKVAAGTGLIYIYPQDLSGTIEELYKTAEAVDFSHEIFRGIPALPSITASCARVAAYGRGKILFLDYPGQPLTPYLTSAADAENYYDYVYSFLSRCVFYVTNRKSPVVLSAVTWLDGRVSAEVSGGDRERALTVKLDVRDATGESEATFSRTIDFKGGIQSVSWMLPAMKRGRHYINLYLCDITGTVLDWATKEIYTDSPAVISSLSLQSDSYSAGETLAGEAVLSNRNREKKDFILLIDWVDMYGRTVDERIVKGVLAPADETAGIPVSVPLRVTFDMPLQNSLSIYNEIRVLLTTGKTVVDEARVVFFVRHRNWDDYPVVLWHGTRLPDYLGYGQAARRLKGIGIDWLDDNPREISDSQAVLGLKNGIGFAFVGLNRFDIGPAEFKKAETTLVRNPCLTDPVYLATLKNSLQSHVVRMRRYGPLLYSVGDENSLTSYTMPLDIDFAETTLAEFREYLKKEYGSLAALNTEWETRFTVWDEVKPMTTAEVLSRKTMNFAPWAEHRTFMDGNYADTLKFCRDAIREKDPETKVGECGTERQSTYGGNDWYRKMQVWDVLQPYSEIGDQLLMERSFSNIPIGGYSSTQPTPAATVRLPYRLWWGLFNGETFVSFWFTPWVMNPDFTTTVCGDIFKRYVKDELKNGIGRLISSSERMRDGVAVLYSQPSCQASYILKTVSGYDTETEYQDNLNGWVKFLNDAGFQFEFVAAEQIEEGVLIDRKYRMLILPLARAISIKQAAEIKKFVDNGGAVIADCQTGLFDENLKAWQTPVLDGLFGIKRHKILPERASVEMVYKGISLQTGIADAIETGIAADATLSAPSLTVGSLTLAEKGNTRPAVVSNVSSKGGTVYLNFMTDYANRRKVHNEGSVYTLLNDVLERTGMLSRVHIVETTGNTVFTYAQRVMFRRGGDIYLGVLAEPGVIKEAEHVRIELPGMYHVYDIRNRLYLGRRSSIETDITSGVALLYGLLQEKADSLCIRIAGDTFSHGQVVKAAITCAPKRDVVVRMDCQGPDGNAVDYFSGNVELASGRGEILLPLALNEKPGRYTLQAREITGGQTDTIEFTVGDGRKNGRKQ